MASMDWVSCQGLTVLWAPTAQQECTRCALYQTGVLHLFCATLEQSTAFSPTDFAGLLPIATAEMMLAIISHPAPSRD